MTEQINSNKNVSTTQFIEMSKENLEKYAGSFKSIDTEPFLIYDIDRTLYSSNENIEQGMMKCITEYAFSKTSNLTREEFEQKITATSYEDINLVDRIYNHIDIDTDFYDTALKTYDFKKNIKPKHELREFIDKINLRKICFTNGTAFQSRNVLENLGLIFCFEYVICADNTVKKNPYKKPFSQAFEFVNSLFGISKESTVYYFDNKLTNIENGKKFGWQSFLVEPDHNINILTREKIKNFDQYFR
ncbi:Haloacid dehalogenase-like hydrolase [Pseudoloma neurophilia]|uniref:Haloacid dehalogenase-like hydrolase n=1 Tax=Pseudoloma neurophilia TaxID=146866 RepID=A0A0R0M2I1_9MICR|nr:Haloacid dehalogenase-like hydrolase [Pseudoloma neurophilia]